MPRSRPPPKPTRTPRVTPIDGSKPRVAVLGTRGVPGSHGGFESFLEAFAPYLVEKGWDVTVYCQEEGPSSVREDEWMGVHRVVISVPTKGAMGTVAFDFKSVLHCARHGPPLALVLGYNTAVFSALLRVAGTTVVTNMDGIEWSRQKWSAPEKAWLWLNERFGCWFSQYLVADHPEIKKHLSTRARADKIAVIPYGARRTDGAPAEPLDALGLEPEGYSTIIARPEPENSIHELVSAFSRRPRGHVLAVLGRYHPESNPYHAKVMAAASDEVRFLGPIYEADTLDALRRFSRLYLHGHTVGGTNPSLVEALGAGTAVVAHDNRFNRWVAGPANHYFSDEDQCDEVLTEMVENDEAVRESALGSRERFELFFQHPAIHAAYEELLLAAASGRSLSHASVWTAGERGLRAGG